MLRKTRTRLHILAIVTHVIAWATLLISPSTATFIITLATFSMAMASTIQFIRNMSKDQLVDLQQADMEILNKVMQQAKESNS